MLRRRPPAKLTRRQCFVAGGGLIPGHAIKHGELRKAGVRITRPRRIILDILTSTEDHPDAMKIFHRAIEIADSISLSTVYRTMNLLEEMGAIHFHFTAS